MTRVVHLKREPYDVRIDRRSKFGNPFVIGIDGDRTEVIDCYKRWLKGESFVNFKQVERHIILRDLQQLKDKVLGCWCHPQPCHGDVLTKMLEERK